MERVRWMLTTVLAVTAAAAAAPGEVAPIMQRAPLDPVVVCRDSHRCSGVAEIDGAVTTCHCDRDCDYFGDCCSDAPRNPLAPAGAPELGSFACTQEDYLLVIQCPVSEDRVSELCHRRTPRNDPYMQVPVTDTSRNYTYANYYCALCHGVRLEEMVFWDVEVKCNGVAEDAGNGSITDKLVFNKEMDSWGFWLYTDRLHFETCTLLPKQPDRLRALYSPRSCFHDLVDACPPSWRGTRVDDWCGERYAPVFGERGGYRNAHCALCNGERPEEMSCVPRKVEYGVKSVSLPSFAILLDMNPDAGKRVGKILTCEEGQVTFSGECRSLTCGIPGYVLKDGKCVKEG